MNETLRKTFRLERPIGRGASGVVYRGSRNGRDVVVKVAEEARDPAEASRLFRREAAIHGSLRHPAVPRIFEVGVAEGEAYIVSEFCAGRSLAELLAEGPLGEARTIALGRTLAGALAAIHPHGVVHRDIKPSNVVASSEGEIRLIDFGLAAQDQHSTEGETAGTLRYSAPEQAGVLRRPIDGRTDLYSLGILLFECIHGAPPFTGTDLSQLLHSHAAVVPPRLDALDPRVDSVLSSIVERLLRKDPDDRYPNAAALADDLERIDELRAARASGLEVVLADPARTAPPRGVFVGRDDELARIGALLPGTPGAEGVGALVTGPPGAGKTRLLEEALRRGLPPNTLVLRGRCVASDPYPLAPLREALLAPLAHLREVGAARRSAGLATLRAAAEGLTELLVAVDPRLAEALGAPGFPVAAEDGEGLLQSAIATFLCRYADLAGGAVLWLDDVQWLDESSRVTLGHLLGRVAGHRLTVILSGRPGRDGTRGLITGIPGADRLRAMPLAPLGADEVTALVRESVGENLSEGFTRRIGALTQGNPLVLTQYLQAMKESGALVPVWGGWVFDEGAAASLHLSSELHSLFTRRLRGLTRPTRLLLAMGARLGPRFPIEMLLDVAHPASLADVQQALAEASMSQLVETVAGGDEVAFLHDRVREALLADASVDPVEVHRRAADHLDRKGARHGRAVFERAWHHVRGWSTARPAAVVRACLDAAVIAMDDHACGPALELLQAAPADAGLPQLPAEDQLAWHRTLGRAEFEHHAIEGAIASFRHALAYCHSAEDRAEVRGAIARAHLFAFDTKEALRELERAFLELGEPLPSATIPDPDALRAHLLGLLHRHIALLDQPPAAPPTPDEHRRHAIVIALADISFLLGYYDRIPTLALQGGVLSLLPAHLLGPSPEACRGYSTLAMLLGLLGKADGVRRFGDRALAMARSLGKHQTLAMTQSVVAIARNFVGEVDVALQLQREVFERHADWLSPLHFQNCCIDLGWSYFVRGLTAEELDVAQTAIQRLGPDPSPFLSAYACRASAASAQAAASLGQMQLATRMRAEVDRFRAIVPPDRTIPWVSVEGYLVGYHAAQGDLGEGYVAAVERHDRWGHPPERSALHARHFYVHHAYAELERHLAEGGEPTRLASAVDELSRCGAGPLLVAHTRVLQGYLALAAGDADGAATLSAEANTLARTWHNPWALFQVARLDAALHAQAGRAEASQFETWSALTLARRQGWRLRTRRLEARLGADRADTGQGVADSTTPHGTRSTDSTVPTGLHHAYKVQLEALLSLARATASVVAPDAQMRIALDEIVRQLGAERGYLFTSDEAGRPTFRYGRSGAGEDLASPTEYSSRAIDQALATGQPVLVGSREDAVHIASRSILAHDLRSVLAAPLQAGDRRVGVVYVENRLAHGVFTRDQLELLRALGSSIASAIQMQRAARLESALKSETERRRFAESVQALMSEVSSTLHLTEGLERLLDGLKREIPYSRGLVAMGDEAGLTCVAMRGFDEAGAQRLLSSSAICRAIQLGPPWGEIELDEPPPAGRHAPEDGSPERKAYLCPLLSSRKTIGYLVLVEDRAVAWKTDEQKLCELLVSQASVAIDNARLFRQVRMLAEQDGLTGLLNRREFFRQAELVYAEAHLTGTPIATLMFDVDHFKRFNDKFGHATGDEVLRLVARVSQEALRQGDLIGRYGGEEFAAVLPNASPQQAHGVGERLRAAVEAARLADPSLGHVTVTISVGLAVRTEGETLTQLLSVADQALYASKAGGRNRVSLLNAEIAW